MEYLRLALQILPSKILFLPEIFFLITKILFGYMFKLKPYLRIISRINYIKWSESMPKNEVQEISRNISQPYVYFKNIRTSV